jgi:CubicO group peptidase (beta-lactamase class C family)
MRPDRIGAQVPAVGPGEPGYVVAVVRDGQVLAHHADGVADIATGEPLTLDHVFYVGSIAKQFVAACVALLWRDGLLDPADPVGRYVAALPPWHERVTVAHLVHHTAGLPPPPYLANELTSAGVPPVSTADRLARVAAVASLDAEPGSAYVYSNHGYTLLAEAVAQVAGRSLAAVAAERIFAPLQMTHTRFRDTVDALHDRAARGHFRVADGAIHREPARFHAVGAGGLWTTVGDLARWDANFDDDRITDGWLPRQLTTRGRLSDGRDIHYAWGVSVRTHRGLPIVSHGGNFPGWESKMVRFPEQRVAFVCLANREDLDVSSLTFRVADEVLAEAIDANAPTAQETRSL